MIRRLLVAMLTLAACTPAATTPSDAPTSTPAAASVSLTPSPASSVPTTPTGPATSPSATPISLPSAAEIAAAGNGVVWALVAGDHLYRSTDRGGSWSERSIPPGGGDVHIAFVSDTTGVAIRLGSPATQCQRQSVFTYRTTDGAMTWQPVGASSDTAQCKSSLAFVDAQHGYMTSSDTSHSPQIWRTSDGGVTWLASELADPPGFTTTATAQLQVGNIADFGSALFADAWGPVSGTVKHFVYRSSDRGAAWSYASTALQATPIVFLTPTRWLQISIPSDSRVTTDAGRSWAFFPSDYEQAAPVAPQIAFGDASTGYASVRGSIQRTTDGGAHWSPIKTPGTLSP